MKRLFLVAFLIILSSLCFASTLNVCLCPANMQIKEFLEDTVKTVPYSAQLSELLSKIRTERDLIALEESLHKAYGKENSSEIRKAENAIASYSYKDDGEDFQIKVSTANSAYSDDHMVLKYLCSLNNCEVLVFSEIKDLDSVSLRTITVYNLLYDETVEISTVISSQTDAFTIEELLNLGAYFSYSPVTETSEVSLEEYSGLNIETNIPAEVFIEGKSIGWTPFTIEKYSLPLVISLKAEGYSDRYISITEETEKVETSLKPKWMEDSLIYSKSSDSFYASFGRMLLSIGLKAALNAVIPSDSSYYRMADTLTSGLIVISIGNMIYNLIDYYNSATYNTNR